MKITNIFISIIMLFFGILNAHAESASIDFAVNIPEYFQITNITSPILNANITDDTGNLYTPLYSTFRVISNSENEKTIYLKANTITESGLEDAMFYMNGHVYIAFTNVMTKPKSQALTNCKNGGFPNESPGVVAYPVASIAGAKHKYSRGRYEVYVKNGVTDISVNIGTNVLRNSFAKNDPKGFYQATLLLTEADI